MKYAKQLIIFATLLIVVGGASLLFFRDRQTTVVTPPPAPVEIQQAKAAAATIVAAQPAAAPNVPVISGEPSSLYIPSLNIDLAVTPGVFNAQTREWTLTRDKAQYAVMTPEPNTVGGNTFIYGHYRRGVFSTLHRIQPGARAIVTTKDGRKFTYVYQTNRVVAPENVSGVFDYQGKPILTLQTCTGLFYENRQLFTFNLEGVS